MKHVAILCFFLAGVSAGAETPLFADTDWGETHRTALREGPGLLPHDLPMRLAAPPMAGSLEAIEEFLFLKILSSWSEDARVASEIHHENDPSVSIVDVFQRNALIPEESAAPFTHALLRSAADEAGWFALREKNRFKRARPNTVFEEIQPVIPVPEHPAYPSGHATQAFILAIALSEIRQSCRNAYHDLAQAVSLRREIAGVHFRSDSLAGRHLAEEIWFALRDLPGISKMMEHAREEMFRQAGASICRIRNR